MVLATKQPPKREKTLALSSVATLALWRFRQTRFMLLVTGIGMIVAVMLICTVPLFAYIVTSAGLHQMFNTAPENPYLTLTAFNTQPTAANIELIERQIVEPVTRDLKPYSAAPPALIMHMQDENIIAPRHNPKGYDSLQLYGIPAEAMTGNVKLLEGRFPQPSPDGIEVMLPRPVANGLKLTPGSLLTIQCDLKDKQGKDAQKALVLRVVGIFDPGAQDSAFWHGVSFAETNVGPFTIFSALASSEGLQNAMHSYLEPDGYIFSKALDLSWHYYLDASLIGTHSGSLLSDLRTLQTQMGTDSSPTAPPYVQKKQLTGPMLGTEEEPGFLVRYQDRLNLLEIPKSILTLQILIIILFAIALMTELLVVRQAESIAVLRSRGAHRGQIFGSLMTQSIGLGCLAFVLGPLLAFGIVLLIGPILLQMSGREIMTSAQTVFTDILFSLVQYALLGVVATLITMALSIYSATGTDVLSWRREMARSTRRPLWQRARLDIILAFMALVSYGISQYMLNTSAFAASVASSQLITLPLALVAPLLLALALVLLLLRFFPNLLSLLTQALRRSRGAMPVLALEQMARSPGQFVRMILGMAFALAFAIFSLVYFTAQEQHSTRVANYYAPSDFSGVIANQSRKQVQLRTVEQQYQALPGVLAASVSYRDKGSALVEADKTPEGIVIQAVNPKTFAQAVTWSTDESADTLPALMRKLEAEPWKDTELADTTLSALVDASLASALQLHQGDSFSIALTDSGLDQTPIYVLAIVPHIPPLMDVENAGSRDYSTGIVVDYDTYAAMHPEEKFIVPNYAWIRAREDTASRNRVQNALTTGPLRLNELVDRESSNKALHSDAFTLELRTLLLVGATTALLLTFASTLLSSWLSARLRLHSFALLRALGMDPGQIIGVILWEQGMIYATSLLLGCFLGLFLSFTVLPHILVTGDPSGSLHTDTFYLLQHIIVPQVLIPPSLGWVMLALTVLCGLVLLVMVRTISRPLAGLVLRLNQD